MRINHHGPVQHHRYLAIKHGVLKHATWLNRLVWFCSPREQAINQIKVLQALSEMRWIQRDGWVQPKYPISFNHALELVKQQCVVAMNHQLFYRTDTNRLIEVSNPRAVLKLLN